MPNGELRQVAKFRPQVVCAADVLSLCLLLGSESCSPQQLSLQHLVLANNELWKLLMKRTVIRKTHNLANDEQRRRRQIGCRWKLLDCCLVHSLVARTDARNYGARSLGRHSSSL